MALILVADDNELLADSIAQMLRSEGHNVLIASDGDRALRLARKVPPDLLILDVAMPRMDGLEVCRELRRDTRLAETLVLMLTVKREKADALLGFDAGADDYLGKPFHMRELMARVEALLRRRLGQTS